MERKVVEERHIWSTVLCFMGASLIWTVFVLLHPQPAWALDCVEETQFYNNWNIERLYADSDLFSDSENLPYGTEVCPIAIHKRWMTTWIKVRLDNGHTGWVDEDDLATATEFRYSIRTRHADKAAELNALLETLDDMEIMMQDYGIAVPTPDLNRILLTWVRAEALPSDAADTDAQDSTAGPTPTPRPTRTPRPTQTPTPTPSPDGKTMSNPVPMGTDVELRNLTIAVISTSDITRAVQSANMFNSTPPAGMIFLEIQIRISKTSAADRELNVGPWDFELFDSQGIPFEDRCDWNVMPDTMQELETMDLYGNPTLIRSLCFTVPDDYTHLLLQYDAAFDWEEERWLAVQ